MEKRKLVIKSIMIGLLLFAITHVFYYYSRYYFHAVRLVYDWSMRSMLIGSLINLVFSISHPFSYIIFIVIGHKFDLFGTISICMDLIFWILISAPFLLELEKKKLIGITICGVFLILAGIFHLHLGIYHLLARSLFITRFPIIPVFFACVGLLLLFSGVSLVLLKIWGRLLTIWSIVTMILYDFYCLWYYRHLMNNKFSYSKTYNDYYFYLFILLIFGTLFYYLTRPKVKEQFK